MLKGNEHNPDETAIMYDYQHTFIDLALAQSALAFGEFTLKSGRISPYFFNAGRFNSGTHIAIVGQCYAQAIVASAIEFDVLFGPAYKGIPLVVATAIALSKLRGQPIGYCFNRKEVKDHGEGGMLIGAPLQGKVLIIDDVITAGTALNEAVTLIKAAGAMPVGAMLALDRQERASNAPISAVMQAERQHHLTISAIINLQTLIAYGAEHTLTEECLDKLKSYQKQYGLGAC